MGIVCVDRLSTVSKQKKVQSGQSDVFAGRAPPGLTFRGLSELSVCEFFGSHLENPEIFPGRKEVFEPGVIAQKPINYFATGVDDLRGQVDQGVEKGLRFQASAAMTM